MLGKKVREEGGEEHMPEAADEGDAERHGWGSEADVKREIVFTAFVRDAFARRRKAEHETELHRELRKHNSEAGVKLRGDSEDKLLCAGRMKATKDILHSGRKVSGGFEKFDEEISYSQLKMAAQVLEKIKGHWV